MDRSVRAQASGLSGLDLLEPNNRSTETGDFRKSVGVRTLFRQTPTDIGAHFWGNSLGDRRGNLDGRLIDAECSAGAHHVPAHEQGSPVSLVVLARIGKVQTLSNNANGLNA